MVREKKLSPIALRVHGAVLVLLTLLLGVLTAAKGSGIGVQQRLLHMLEYFGPLLVVLGVMLLVPRARRVGVVLVVANVGLLCLVFLAVMTAISGLRR